MFVDFKLLARVGELLEYPDGSLRAKAADLADCVGWYGAIWEDLVEAFALHVSLTPLEELEETYTKAFDMNPSCTLEIGWHLFGETYKRGSFLANLRPALRDHGLEEAGKLPDHLALLLPLMGRLPKAEAEGLGRDCVLPALEKLRPKLEGGAPYDTLLEAIEMILRELVSSPEAKDGCGCGHDHGTCKDEVDHAR